MQLTATNLQLAFGDRVVFEGADLRVDGPGLVALMGPSGSGKSSFLAIVAGRVTPDGGQVTVTPDTPPPSVEWIVQSSPLLTRRAAIENVALGPLSRGATHGQALVQALSAMARLGIDHLAGTQVSRLSGGERQRVAVARSISRGAGILLADEPTASLDAHSRSEVCDALAEASAAGSLVLVATHDRFVADQCDVVYRLDAGRFALDD